MRTAVLVACCALLASPTLPAQAPEIVPLEKLYRDYVGAGVDATRSAKVAGLKLFEDDIRITLEKGTLYPLERVGGLEHGAIFIGTGRFVFVPPSDVEEAALLRALDRRSILKAESSLEVTVLEDGSIDVRVRDYASEILLDRPFQVAVLRFSPDFASKWGIQWENTPGPRLAQAQKAYAKRHKLHRRAVDKGFDGFDIDLLTMSASLPSEDPPSFTLFEARLDGFTVKHFGTARSHPWLSYWRSDDEGEEHELFVLEPRTGYRSNLEALSASGAAAAQSSGAVLESDPAGAGRLSGGTSTTQPTAPDDPVFIRRGIGSNTLTFRPRRPSRSPGLMKTIIASFHERAERQQYDPLLLASESHPRIDVEDLELKLTFEKGGRRITAEAILHFQTLVGSEWIALELASAQPHPSNAATFGRIKVESVTQLEGQPLDFLHTGGALLVRLAEPRVSGQRGAVRVTYSGDVVWPDEVTTMDDLLPSGASGQPIPFRNRGLDFLPEPLQSYSPLAGFAFYPRGPGADRARLDLTVCSPKHTSVIATGRQVKTWRDKEKKQNCSRHIENRPVRDVAILFGNYSCETRDYKDLPRIRACAFPRQARSVRGMVREAEGLLRVYEVLYGKFPFDELDIVQTGFDQSFTGSAAGVIYMEGVSFLSKSVLANELNSDRQPDVGGTFALGDVQTNARVDVNIRHQRLATLAARQWWGEKVGPRTQHDVWLMEAAVEYGAAIYIAKLRKPELFEMARRRWMQDARRWEIAGPLWLGPSRIDYQAAFASKGPAVLHMLRDQMGTDPFFECLRTLASLANGRDASTEELQTVCEKIHGQPLQWFFDAWVRGGTLPEVRYNYAISSSPEKKGTWDLSGKVKLGHGFLHSIRIPVVLEFEGRETQRVNLFVDPTDGAFSIKQLPARPSKFRIDDEVLLARSVRRKAKL